MISKKIKTTIGNSSEWEFLALGWLYLQYHGKYLVFNPISNIFNPASQFLTPELQFVLNELFTQALNLTMSLQYVQTDGQGQL